ncbi:hypothetical protein TIFTF001_032112 [Ficus carica]|uniref:Uncharacterized protein n=1 Tax=Ficus carica TaxID=3494 RepID=A0AA88J203_FICCA|nr:hypothetical protein TIFTF001_032112 [Ficus carica]
MLEGGLRTFTATTTSRPALAMDEQDNQDFQDIDNPAPTGTQRLQRGRRARA